MQDNSFSMADAMRLAASPAGQQLFSILQQKDDTKVKSAMNLAASGDYRQAKQILSELMADPEARKVLEQLGGSL